MRQKRLTSKILAKASARASGLESVDPVPDVGPHVTVVGYKAKIDDTQGKLNAYNTLLAEVDEARNLLEASEKELNTYGIQMLAAVGIKFGRNSNEYEMAGGRRPMDRRRPRLAPLAPKPTT